MNSDHLWVNTDLWKYAYHTSCEICQKIWARSSLTHESTQMTIILQCLWNLRICQLAICQTWTCYQHLLSLKDMQRSFKWRKDSLWNGNMLRRRAIFSIPSTSWMQRIDDDKSSRIRWTKSELNLISWNKFCTKVPIPRTWPSLKLQWNCHRIWFLTDFGLNIKSLNEAKQGWGWKISVLESVG